MLDTSTLTDHDFQNEVHALIQRELGSGGFARFLRLYRSSTGDATRDRHQWLGGVTIEQIKQEARSQNAA